MRTPTAGPAEYAGSAVAAILAAGSAEEVLRHAFPEAQTRGNDLHVLIAGEAAVSDALSVREAVDPAIAVVAAARQGSLLVSAGPASAHERAVLEAVTRRLQHPISLV